MFHASVVIHFRVICYYCIVNSRRMKSAQKRAAKKAEADQRKIEAYDKAHSQKTE